MVQFYIDFVGHPAFGNSMLMFGILIAFFSVKSAHKTARQKATAEMLNNMKLDARLSNCAQKLKELHESSASLRLYVTDEEKSKSSEASDIRYILNHWERICSSVHEGILCEDILKRSSYNTIVDTHKFASQYIEAVREKTKKDTFYQELGRLCERWKKTPLKVG